MADNVDLGVLLKAKFPAANDRALAGMQDSFEEAGIYTAQEFKKMKRDDLNGFLPAFTLKAFTEKGVFMQEGDEKLVQAAKLQMERVRRIAADFIAPVVSEVPWPSLNKMPKRVVTIVGDANDTLWLVGRGVFKGIEEKFCALAREEAMYLDGVVGGGKSYLLIMLALHLCRAFAEQPEKRLICLFTMPVTEHGLFCALKKAFVFAFWDVPTVHRLVLASPDMTELQAVMLGPEVAAYDLHFIVDQWNNLDGGTQEVDKVRSVVNVMLLSGKGLRGGSARQESVIARAVKADGPDSDDHWSLFDELTAAELSAFLKHAGGTQDDCMWSYTGYLPLWVRLFLQCQKEVKQGENVVDKYLNTIEVQVLGHCLAEMASSITPEKRQCRVQAFTDLLMGRARTRVDPRWVVIRDGKFGLFSDYARWEFMTLLEQYMDGESAEDMIENFAVQAMDECAMPSGSRNHSLLGWLAKRLAIYVLKRWVVGEEPDVEVERVEYFSYKPSSSAQLVTTCVPKDYNFPYMDAATKYERQGKLTVIAYEVSLSLGPGSTNYNKPDGFFEPLFLTRFDKVQPSTPTEWVYTFVGRRCHIPVHYSGEQLKTTQGTRYKMRFVSFGQLSEYRNINHQVKQALRAVDRLND